MLYCFDVQYDNDGDNNDNWVGLDFFGHPGNGGTGCCESVNDCSTVFGAAKWLKER